MTATVTITPTADPTNSPPRMKLDVTATGTPTVSSVTISREDPDGSIKLVRTTDGGPLVLSAGAGTVYDYEIPPGESVTYSIPEGSAPTTTTSMNTGAVWLVHLGVPSRSVSLRFRRGSFTSETWAIEQGVFPILGRATPIVVTGSARTAPASSFTVAIDQPADLTALRILLADGSPLFLSADVGLGYGIDTNYIAAGNVTVSRPVQPLLYSERDVEIPYQVVGRPAGGTRAGTTWADVAAEFATWASIPVGKTWAQLAAGT